MYGTGTGGTLLYRARWYQSIHSTWKDNLKSAFPFSLSLFFDVTVEEKLR
jgi:hypothetical protein